MITVGKNQVIATIALKNVEFQNVKNVKINNMKTIDDFINTVIVDKANFEHIAKHGSINGTLLTSLRDVLQRYAKEYHEAEMEKLKIVEPEKIDITKYKKITPSSSCGFCVLLDRCDEIHCTCSEYEIYAKL